MKKGNEKNHNAKSKFIKNYESFSIKIYLLNKRTSSLTSYTTTSLMPYKSSSLLLF